MIYSLCGRCQDIAEGQVKRSSFQVGVGPIFRAGAILETFRDVHRNQVEACGIICSPCRCQGIAEGQVKRSSVPVDVGRILRTGLPGSLPRRREITISSRRPDASVGAHRNQPVQIGAQDFGMPVGEPGQHIAIGMAVAIIGSY